MMTLNSSDNAINGTFKTRSGKIMRRLLRNITNGNADFGDISVVADVEHVEIEVEQVVQPANRRFTSQGR